MKNQDFSRIKPSGPGEFALIQPQRRELRRGAVGSETFGPSDISFGDTTYGSRYSGTLPEWLNELTRLESLCAPPSSTSALPAPFFS